jgi:hypothetical protein
MEEDADGMAEDADGVVGATGVVATAAVTTEVTTEEGTGLTSRITTTIPITPSQHTT